MGIFFLFGPNCYLPAAAAIIIFVAFIAYIPSISGGFIWDDELLITQNPLIKASDGIYQIWCTNEEADYWPVVNNMFWIEWRLWDKNPIGYHLANLFLHVVEALLIWIILRKLSIPGAFLAALIFAIHPVNVESVAWIAQGKNAMAMLLFLLSILCYLKMGEFPPSGNKSAATGPRLFSRWYWLSLSAFVLAMLSKGSVAVLPVLFLVIVWWQRTAGRMPSIAGAARSESAKKRLLPRINKWDLMRPRLILCLPQYWRR